MKSLRQLLTNLMTEDSSQDLLEYAIVAALLGLAVDLASKGLSNSIGTASNGVGNSLTNAVK